MVAMPFCRSKVTPSEARVAPPPPSHADPTVRQQAACIAFTRVRLNTLHLVSKYLLQNSQLIRGGPHPQKSG